MAQRGIGPGRAFEFPRELEPEIRRARIIEYWTIGYLISAVVLMYLVLGNSQAMRTAWFEDMLSLIPPVVFLVANRYALRPPNESFPWGHHRLVSAAYLAAAFSLLAMGTYLLIQAVLELVHGRHPTIGTITLFGWTMWLGWPMCAALLYSALPAVVLGRMKLPLANRLYDKVLYADAKMNKADWLTALAGIVGILGIGYGFWWADAAAAGVIALDIAHDGWVNTKAAIEDLIDQRPQKVDRSGPDPVLDKVRDRMSGYPWIRDFDVRLRVVGHTLFGEAFVVPRSVDSDLPHRVEQAIRDLRGLDWRLHDISLSVVPRLAPDVDERVEGHGSGTKGARPE